MKKDIEWLKAQICTEMMYLDHIRKERWSGVKYQTLRSVAQKINQLDEPEVLSQEWIDEHKVARVNNLRKMTMSDVVPIDDLQNLIVPKQEITEEQVMNWLDKNDFYDHITAETVLERAVDKGKLSYYGTKYSVIKTSTIPKYVAEWIEGAKDRKLTLYGAICDCPREVDYWLIDGDCSNQEAFARAWLDGYTVEEEQKYYVLDSEGVPLLEKSGNQIQRTTTELSIHEKGRDNTRYKLTEQEIKGYDKRYWPFAEQVEQADFRLSF